MYKLTIILFTFLGATISQETPFKFPNMTNFGQELVASISNVCKVEAEQGFIKCGTSTGKAFDQAKFNEMSKGMTKALNDNDIGKVIEFAQKMEKYACCNMWAMFDCFSKTTLNCSKADQTNLNNVIMKYVKPINKENSCKNYQYHSKQCASSNNQTNPDEHGETHPDFIEINKIEGMMKNFTKLISHNCSQDIQDYFSSNCNKTFYEKYMTKEVENITLQLIDELKNGDHANASPLIDKLAPYSCCSTWFAVDCIKPALNKCTKTDQDLVQNTFDQIKQTEEEGSCRNYKYQSDQCKGNIGDHGNHQISGSSRIFYNFSILIMALLVFLN